MLTDMPPELGGSGDQVTPGWLFRAGIASCTATVIAMIAAEEGIELTTIEVKVTSRSDARGMLGMADETGAMVFAGLGGMQMHVRIGAKGANPQALRELVDRGTRCSPMFNAVQSATADCRRGRGARRGRLMDALSETLRVVRLIGAIFVQARFTAPWCYHSPPADAAAPVLEPGAEKVVIFHLITEGECFVEVKGGPPMHLTAGDVVIFPQGDAHLMSSQLGLKPKRSTGLDLAHVFRRRPRQVSYGGGGTKTVLVCGYLACDARLARLLLAGLPPVVRVNVRGSNAGVWLEASVRYALAEARSPRPGGAGVLAKLAEVLFIEVLRLYMNEQSVERTGWLAGVADRIVGAALSALHKRPAHAWSLDELAKEAGTSRSVLAERFQQMVGTAPMQYLTQWRMLLAANLLSRSNAPLSRIAEDVGYQTDTAFIRAFRREYGTPPAAWRRTQAAREQSA